MSKQDSDYLETSQPMPSAPPSYDHSSAPAYYPELPAQDMSANPPYQYQPVPVVHEARVQAPQQVIVQTTGPVPVGPYQITTTCPQCHATIKSRISSNNTCGAHLCCCLLFMIGCCLCSCIPYCMDSFKIINHSCPNCKAFLGTYRAS